MCVFSYMISFLLLLNVGDYIAFCFFLLFCV